MEYELKLLKEIPFVAPILAHWAYRTWYLESSIDFRAVVNDYSRRDNSDSLPVAVVAVVKGNFPVGMVSLKKSDLQSRPDLSPWLSALYVLPEFRNNGIAENLINYLLNLCKASAINRVHLFIDRKNENYLQEFYSKRGWDFFSEENDHEGSLVKILCFNIK